MHTRHRIEALRARMEERKLEALLIAEPSNRRYISGFTGTSGYVLITMDRAVLFTDFRYMTQAAAQCPDLEVIRHKADYLASIKPELEKSGIKRLGFEQNHTAYGDYRKYAAELNPIELVPVENLTEELRMKKDESELAIIRQAARLADQAFEHILAYIRPGLRERDVDLELEIFMRRNGASGSSFATIVASGERSALPHGVSSDRVIQPGDFVTLDFGAYYQGYCSDITRTIAVGKPSDKHREIYEIVLEAQMNCLERIRPGMTGREADALTRDIIKRYGYNDYFGHGTGHGIGLEIHEAPRLSPTSEQVLEPGMTVTVEPGIYLPGFGGVRIEDDIVITDTGMERLTTSSKAFTVIDS